MPAQQLQELLLRNQSGTGANLLNEYIQHNIHNIEFYKDLLQIFVENTDRVSISAGLVLKNHIHNISDPAFIEFLTTELLKAPHGDRFRVGIVGTILGKLHLHFPHIPVAQHILELFVNDPSVPMFNIIDKMCQEKELDLQPQHFSIILHHLTMTNYARFAFELVSNSIKSHHIDAFIPELIHALTIVPSSYRQQSLQLLAKIAEFKSQLLMQSNFEETLKYVFSHFDLDGAEFILSFVENNNFRDALQPYLTQLLPLLLLGMQYSSEEVQAILEDDEIVPKHHLTKVHNLQQQTSDDEDDIDFYGDWNLRKCCASSLDALSECFQGLLLPILLPLLKESFSSTDWLVREAGILALGAIADGCEQDLNNFLNELIPFLINSTTDQHPLVASISLWCLSRFSLFICHSFDTDPGSYFEPTLQAFLQGITNPHLKVQESACAATTVFTDYANTLLVPYKVAIMNAIVPCLSQYSKKNLIMLMDLLGALAFSLHSELRDVLIMDHIMPPLLQYWELIKINDVVYPTLLDCLQHLMVAFGPLVLPSSQAILYKAGNTINTAIEHLRLNQGSGLTEVEYETSHIVSNLDLISGLLNGLDTESAVFLTYKTELNAIFVKCLEFKDAGVDQSVFGLLGELTRFQPLLIQDNIAAYYKQALTTMNAILSNGATSNAVWFIGQVIVQTNGQISDINQLAPALDMLIQQQQHDNVETSMIENGMVCLAILGIYHPEVVIAQIKGHGNLFINMLNVLHDPHEKISAWSGVYAMVATLEFGEYVGMLLKAIANCKTNEHDLYEILVKVI